MTASTANIGVTSTTSQRGRGCIAASARSITSRSRTACALPVTIMNSSSASRVIVKSLS